MNTHTPPKQTALFALFFTRCFNFTPSAVSTFSTVPLKPDPRTPSRGGCLLLLFVDLWHRLHPQTFHSEQARARISQPHSPRVRRGHPAVPRDDRGNEALEEFHVCTVTLSVQAPVRAHSDRSATHHHLSRIRLVCNRTDDRRALLHPGTTTACQTLTSPQVPLCCVRVISRTLYV